MVNNDSAKCTLKGYFTSTTTILIFVFDSKKILTFFSLCCKSSFILFVDSTMISGHARSVMELLLLVMTFLLHGGYLSEGAKILIPGPVIEGMGHIQVLSTLTARLVQSGHNVTVLSGSKMCSGKFAASNASHVIRYQSPNAILNSTVAHRTADVKYHDYNPSQQLEIFWGMYDNLRDDCRALLSNKALLKKLKAERFDILIGDVISPCDIFVANILGIPWIAVTANREYICISNYIYRVPVEHSYVPHMGLYMLTDKMSFLQRLGNVLFAFTFDYYHRPTIMSDFMKIKEEFNIAPEMDIWQLASKAEIWLTQTSVVLDYPAPGIPNVVPVGGLGVRPPNALRKDLEEFVNGSGEHGFIVFSLGSIIKFLPDAPETSIITKVLSELPQRVLWKHDGPVPLNIGKNVRLLKWLPQNDLLGHPKARLFICHGGLNSVYEGITHAVPMVVIPLMLDDQKENAARVAVKGMGITLDRSKLTEEIFRDAIMDVLHNTTYKEAVTRYSQILHDKPPLETAVHWIEHVLKFGGSHLRPNVYDLNLFQYNLLDVYGFLLAVVLGILSFVTYTICFCGRKLVKLSSRHSKVD